MDFSNTVAQTNSSKYNFLYTDFNWLNEDQNEHFSIQSLVVSASFFNIENELKILNELHHEYKDLGFELLVQRDIDKKRVELEIVENYLFLEGKTNFFPPIVVALIPKYKEIKSLSFSTNIEHNNTNLNVDIADSGITESFIVESSSSENPNFEQEFFESNSLKYGTLQWNMEKFNAIIIDGQHRFYALKKFFEKNNSLQKSACFFPINFVVVMPQKNKRIEATKYIKIARELFIDINKNAKKVSHTRQILLDDLDLMRFLTRSSINQYNLTSSNFHFEWKELCASKHLLRIPQAIINWNSDITERDKENIKLFQLAQVTSTSLIYKIIKDFIFRQIGKAENLNIFKTLFRVFEFSEFSPNHNSNEESIFTRISIKKTAFTDKIEEISAEELETQKELAESDNLDSFDSDYYNRKRAILNEKALSFDYELNKWMSNYFYNDTKFGMALVMFYSRFEPFRKVIELIEPFFQDDKYKSITNLLIDPQYNTKSQNLAQIKKEEEKAIFSKLFDELEQLKSNSQDTRYTVFQRSVFADLDKIFDTLDTILPTKNTEEQLAIYIDGLSDLYNKQIFKKDLSLSFDEPLFENSVDEFSVGEFKIWTNIWIVDDANTIKYRDTDAFKIGQLIRILSMASITKKDLDTLKSEYGNRVKIPLNSVKNAYRAAFLKRIKTQFELGSINEAKEKINNQIEFEKGIERIVSKTIEDLIISD